MADPKAPLLGKSGQASLPGVLFSEPFNEGLVHEAVRADLNARRRGTHSSLTRGEVSMTGAKAWRQKGTGRARVGALGVGHRYGGGPAFGPKPRHYTVKVNRKARRKALRAALSVHSARGTVAIVDAGAFSTPSTKEAARSLSSWGSGGPVLVIIGAEDPNVALSFRNIPGVTVAAAAAAGVADVIGARSIVVTQGALTELEGRVTPARDDEKPKAESKPEAEPAPDAEGDES